MVTTATRLDKVVGAKASKALGSAFDLETAGDLLGHYPRRLADRGRLTDLADLRIGEHVTVLAKTLTVKVGSYQPRGGGRRAARTEVVVTDGQRELSMTFFRQPWKTGQLAPGTVAWFSGRVDIFNGRRQLQSPTCEVLGTGRDLEEFEGEEQQRWRPIYPATSSVTSKMIQDSIDLVLDQLDPVPDPVPPDVRHRLGLLPYDEALRLIHRATDPADWEEARRRLRFDEAFVLQTVLAQRRHLMQSLPATPRPPRGDGLRARFDQSLPFTLTDGQVEVGAEIETDLAQIAPHAPPAAG